ncbi:MAG: gliding motility-associated ABC transporter ATP-binding subunit GldA [Bacteroidales bacterium]|nr:gliding motility-associated ABC transporter ATP-binding subunit GldA [Bacteroidales bacterium]
MPIEVKHVTKLFGEQKALDDVTLTVHPGGIVGLLGPNGAGKSTLMKIITCFLPPSDGQVSVNGYNIFGQSLEIRKITGYLPENNPLYTDLYVKEYLMFVAGLHKMGKKKKARVEEMIDITGLTGEQGKKIGALSKGYRQRIGLAQALIHDPEVLILDEPTSGLDPNQLAGMRELIKALGREKTVMISTHIMQEVEAVCSHAVIIDKGKIMAYDRTENLLGSPSENQVVEVEFDKAVDRSLIESLEGVVSALEAGDNTWKVSARVKSDIRSGIFNFAVANNLKVLSMKKTGQSLEEVFRKLTRSAGEV